MICSGLNRILNGCADIRHGQRFAPEVLFMNVMHKFAHRQYDPDMEALVLRLRNKLQAKLAQPRWKFRFDCFELAAVAFALRIAPKAPEGIDRKELAAKLENYRRCAVRTHKHRDGADSYTTMQERWQGFEAWVRYNIIPLRVPKRSRVRAIHREQFEALLNIARSLITERCTEPIDDAVLIRMTKLAKRHVRRGRYNFTLRELLSQPEEAKSFMFQFLRKRIDLPLKFEYLTRVEQMTERGERFRTHLENRAPSPVTLVPISPAKVKAKLGKIFRDEVDRSHWENVRDQAALMIGQTRPANLASVRPESLDELVQISKPVMTIEDGPDEVNFATEWLVKILLGIGASPWQAIDLVQGGYAAALAG
jgi:hypothetical protein